jgi:secretion/DNA translocation related CpaE-like protein
MTTAWVLLLSDDPSITMTTHRLAGGAGVGVHDPSSAGAGPPSLVVIGADRASARSLPPEASGVPRVLVAASEPEDGLWRAALELRAEQIVLLPEAEHVLQERLNRVAGQRRRQGLTVAVIGGCGGAGASVLSVGLARAAAVVARSLLIDLDRFGSGADLLLGAEDEPGLRWPDLTSVRGRLPPENLIGALPVIDGLHVLSGDRGPGPGDLPAPAVSAVLDASRRHYEVIVLDLPRWLEAGAGTAARAADLGLLVVPAQVRATVAARQVLSALQDLLADVRLVVRGPVTSALRPEAVADALELPLAGVLRPEPGLRAALDRGEPPGLRTRGPLSTFCRGWLAGELAEARLDWSQAS